MKKLNENTKVTLTVGQLKRLVRESLVESYDDLRQDYDKILKYHEEHIDKWDGEIEVFGDVLEISPWLEKQDYKVLRFVRDANFYILIKNGHYYLATFDKNGDGDIELNITDAEPVRDIVERII